MRSLRKRHKQPLCRSMRPALPCAAVRKMVKRQPGKGGHVIGFPMGANTTAVKAFEAADAVKNGADELDMVINIGLALEGNWHAVRDDIAAVVEAAQASA